MFESIRERTESIAGTEKGRVCVMDSTAMNVHTKLVEILAAAEIGLKGSFVLLFLWN